MTVQVSILIDLPRAAHQEVARDDQLTSAVVAGTDASDTDGADLAQQMADCALTSMWLPLSLFFNRKILSTS